MATVDIEVPGASEAALKAAIQALVPISTTTISSPVNYVDITLPTGFSAFRLSCSRVYVSAALGNIFLMAVFSEDGGVTWLHDWDGAWEAYQYSAIRMEGGGDITGAGDVHFAARAMGTFFGAKARFASCDLVIDPGAASRPAFLSSVATGAVSTSGTHHVQTTGNICAINTARVNAIRLFSGDGGPDPDALSTVLDGGIFTLYGVL
jgi:hypothetical protein